MKLKGFRKKNSEWVIQDPFRKKNDAWSTHSISIQYLVNCSFIPVTMTSKENYDGPFWLISILEGSNKCMKQDCMRACPPPFLKNDSCDPNPYSRDHGTLSDDMPYWVCDSECDVMNIEKQLNEGTYHVRRFRDLFDLCCSDYELYWNVHDTNFNESQKDILRKLYE